MFCSLTGEIAAKSPSGCLIDVGGVGYRVACSATTLAALPGEGGRAYLWIHTQVREEILALFGFATEAEQRLFEALIGVSGVGPKVALQVCSAFDPDSFRRALAGQDVAAVAGVPGIGKKIAQRIVIELKERLAVPDLHVAGSQPGALVQARSALENLGYSPGEVRAALGELQPSADDPVEAVVKAALKVLA